MNMPTILWTLKYHACGTQNACDVKELCSIDKDAWQTRSSIACEIMEWHKVQKNTYYFKSLQKLNMLLP